MKKGKFQYIPIETLFSKETDEIKKISTFNKNEEKFARILGPIELSIVAYYIDNPDSTDKKIKAALKRLSRNISGDYEENSVEDLVRTAACITLQEEPYTKHEFLLALKYIIDCINRRSYLNEKTVYLDDTVDFFGLPSVPRMNSKKDFESIKSGIKGSLKLDVADGNSWFFKYPPSWDKVTRIVYDALDMFDSSKEKDWDKGEKMLKIAFEIAPLHPLASYQYADFLYNTGKKDKAIKVVEDTITGCRKIFPKDFKAGKDLLEWGWHENRPFLRSLHWIGIQHFDNKDYEKSLEIFEEMLELNPNDNQGIRELAVNCYIHLNLPEKVIALQKKFKDDEMPATTYGFALALIMLGKIPEAKKALKKAVDYSPLIAKELLTPSKTKPKSVMEGYITAGGADEAWDYRQNFGMHWKNTKSALAILEEIFGSKPKKP